MTWLTACRHVGQVTPVYWTGRYMSNHAGRKRVGNELERESTVTNGKHSVK